MFRCCGVNLAATGGNDFRCMVFPRDQKWAETSTISLAANIGVDKTEYRTNPTSIFGWPSLGRQRWGSSIEGHGAGTAGPGRYRLETVSQGSDLDEKVLRVEGGSVYRGMLDADLARALMLTALACKSDPPE